MPPHPRWRPLTTALVLAALAAPTALPAHEGGEPNAAAAALAVAADIHFLAESSAAMTKMMRAMEAKPTGDVDRDFVAMMVPHHQGAIDMAMALLKSTRNEPLRRLAQEIIVTQQQEIAAMQLAVGGPLPPATPVGGAAPPPGTTPCPTAESGASAC